MPRIELHATDGTRLEGRFDAPGEPHGGVAVVCHPHPASGGSMDSWMMPVLARALRNGGWHTLRFNFRGVGGSEGERDGGELLDLAGAVDCSLEEVDSAGPVLVGGWSAGAHVALRYGPDDARVVGWFGVGLPLGETAGDPTPIDREVLARWDVPKLFIHGDRDQVTALAAVRELFESAAEPKRLRVIEGGDHFLAEHGDVLTAELRTFATRLAPDRDDGPAAGPDPDGVA